MLVIFCPLSTIVSIKVCLIFSNFLFYSFFPTACAYTDPFEISQRDEDPKSNKCNLLIFKEGDEEPLKKILFSVPNKVRI